LRKSAVILVIAMLGACGTSIESSPNAQLAADAELTEHWGCGIGFVASNEDQTAALFVYSTDHEPMPPVSFPDPAWDARLVVGEDLMANHCDDVIEPGEPEPVISEEWQVDAGTLTFDLPDGGVCGAAGPVIGTFNGLSASNETTTVDIGDLAIENASYGCFAG
jgi:hypothetical protein